MLVVDDVEVARVGLVAALKASGFTVVGAAGLLWDAEAIAARELPDVAIIDVRLSESSGFDVANSIGISSPDTRFLFVTAHEGCLSEEEIARLSSHSLILKTATIYELCRAVEQVAAGKHVIDPVIAKSLLKKVRSGREPSRALFTQREQAVFELLMEGMGNDKIAEHLGISPRTAKNYVSRILQKLGLSRRSEVPAYAASNSEVASSHGGSPSWTRSG